MHPVPRRSAVTTFLFGVVLGWGLLVRLAAMPWPAAESDLPPPRLESGTLANGVRYFILPSAEPKGHVSLRLMVAAGSAMESDAERGLAHYVEHMAFRGTRTHPDGSVIPTLQRLGIAFGPDTAAFTAYDHVIYHLELPVTPDTLQLGLHVLHEFASEVVFDPAQIEAERGVIISEARFRDTPSARREQSHLQFLWPGSRQAARAPIGDALLPHFTHEQCAAFYDAWYRPDRMIVIAVGDIDPAAMRRTIAARFGDLAPRAAARAEPADLYPSDARKPDVGVFSDPGLVGCSFLIEHPARRPMGRETHADRVRDLHLALAMTMFQRRLSRLSLNPRTTFVGPMGTYDDSIYGWRVAMLGASGRADDWQAVAADLEKEHRRAFLYGFTPRELEEARAAFAARYEEAARTAATWSSSWLADQLALCARLGRVYQDPARLQQDLAADLAAATLEDCRREFVRAWTAGAPDVFVAANPRLQVSARQIAAALNASRATPVSPYAETRGGTFAYGDFGPPGRLVRSEYHDDLDVTLARFENGVRLNFKPTTFAADAVEVGVRVGDGKLSQPENQPGLDLLANAMLLPGGLGRQGIEEISDLVAVTTVRPAFQVQTDAAVFYLRAAKRDLAFGLSLVAAYLTDPGFRPDALRGARAEFGTMYANLAASPGGPISLQAGRVLSSGDRRFGIPLPDEISARSLAELRRWLSPQLKQGAIEVSIVGDVTWDEVRPIVARTLGALPRRRDLSPSTAGAKVRMPAPPRAPVALQIPAQLHQSAVAFYWPIASVDDMHQDRRYVLLSDLLEERLRVRLREELGATYTPVASFERTAGFPHLNWMRCYAEVDPALLPRALALIDEEAGALATAGPAADEFERVKGVYVRQRTDDLRSNSYWGLTVLATAQSQPDNLKWARDRLADNAAITREEVRALAACLRPDHCFRFVTTASLSALSPLQLVPPPAAPAAPALVPRRK